MPKQSAKSITLTLFALLSLAAAGVGTETDGSIVCPSPPRLAKYSSCSSIELVAISSSRLRPLSWKPGAVGKAVVASWGPHHGEEEPIRGHRGSGTVFFTHCTLKCVFCQNYQISIQHDGRTITSVELLDD